MRAPRAWMALVLAAAVAATYAAVASGHIERASYWPLPAVDTSVSPPAGGAVPEPRSLASALVSTGKPCPAVKRLRKVRGRVRVRPAPRATCAASRRRHRAKRVAPGGEAGETLAPGVNVVCQPDSLARAQQAITAAETTGVLVRPTQPREKLSAADGADLLELNADLFALCRFHEIQPAVNRTGNDGRVVIMPGLYTEPTSRKQPTHDPACAKYTASNDHGETGAVTYTYQYHCPNDANLIAVVGRGLGPGADPDPPLIDRHGIPNRGPCIRCNVQIEGSGPSADDVVIDVGRVASGNNGPVGAAKDVGIRADRADGFVLRDVTVRHAGEHNIYILESNGYLLDHFKTFYAGEYGVLTFVEDHGLMQNCDAAGSGDSGLYPGAGGDTGADRDTSVYPAFRYSQEIRYCDSHHNLAGYSGTDGNATHIDRNNFYDNALGFTTDVFTASGHPGFPQDSDLVEYNNFYSNNFNPYQTASDVKPSEPEPVGTGMWIAGGNSNVVRNNRFYDNWRRAAMLFAVPDQLVCGPGGSPVTGCDPSKFSTSYNNGFHDNILGVAPDGSSQPNGQDFWWDSYPSNTGNCWWANTVAASKTINNSPNPLPDCSNGTNPSSSVGTGSSNENELTSCFGVIATGAAWTPGSPTCPWFDTPPKPSP